LLVRSPPSAPDAQSEQQADASLQP
jgi:hypothetical protein